MEQLGNGLLQCADDFNRGPLRTFSQSETAPLTKNWACGPHLKVSNFLICGFDPKFFADNCGLNDEDRNLPHFVRDRVLDLHNTGQSLKNLEPNMQMKCHATPQ